MTLIFTVIVIALAFEYLNGTNDTGNSIATVVSTKVLTPRQAVILAALTNLAGALIGKHVAQTITSGLVDAKAVSMTSDVMICVLIGAITWNVITWWFGLPSSSSHALIGGLCGGALAASHNNWRAIIWSQPNSTHWWKSAGLLWKVVVPMFFSPLLGFVMGFLIMSVLYISLRNQRPTRVNNFFGVAQIFSAGGMGVMHGTNDAQKTMGIITLVLFTATGAGHLDHVPGWLSFMRITTVPGNPPDIPIWIKVTCALVMATGTAIGGWRIIRTLGHKMVKLHPINGFAAETSSAIVIFTASIFGIPVSTTHNISASIMGVGSAKRFNAIKWVVVERMAWAWIFTIPVAGGIAYGLVRLMQLAGWVP